MDDCGRRRREGARVGEVAEAGGETARADVSLGGGEVVAASAASSAAWAVLSLGSLRGSALMRRAWARWLFSRSWMRRRDCQGVSQSVTVLAGGLADAHLGVVGAAQAVVEGGCSELMFVPRALEIAGVGGRRGVAHMLLGFCKRCGVHGCGRLAWACRGRCT